MRFLIVILGLVCSAVYAHTPVCRCELMGEQINCRGGYHDGSNAVDVNMLVITYDERILVTGVLDARSTFNTKLPDQPFYILMDVGPGEIFEVDWRDVVGIDRQLFSMVKGGDW